MTGKTIHKIQLKPRTKTLKKVSSHPLICKVVDIKAIQFSYSTGKDFLKL